MQVPCSGASNSTRLVLDNESPITSPVEAFFLERRHKVPDFELTKPQTAKVYKVLKNSLQAKTNKQKT
jgi:hypothetical protein